MRYYKYVKSQDSVFSFRVHKAVRACRPLAIAKYKSRWEDALDEAFFHVLNNFDDSKGSLESYALSIVGTIYLNKYSREVGSNMVYEIESDKKATKDTQIDNPYEDLLTNIEEEDIDYEGEVQACIQYLLPYFVKDFNLFKNMTVGSRKLKYSGLFEKYPYKVISEAVQRLAEGYDDMVFLDFMSKECKIRSFNEEKLSSLMDPYLRYLGMVEDIVKCENIGSRRKKYAYLINLKDVISGFYSMFYGNGGVASRLIAGETVYCSLSGNLVFSRKKLAECINSEIMWYIFFVRPNLRILQYKEESSLLVSSSRVDEKMIEITVFNTKLYIPMKRMVIGKVESKTGKGD